MKKTLLSAAGGGTWQWSAFSGSAQAQCWWTGLGYSCAAPAVPAPQVTYYQDAVCCPDDALPGLELVRLPGLSRAAAWLPSYPGPRPSGH